VTEWRLIGGMVFVLTLPSVALPQQPAPRDMPVAAVGRDEAAAITSGWALVAEGRHAEASALAVGLLDRYPTSPGVLVLAVEAEIGRGGGTSALGLYERWLGVRTVEEPLVLRRIARAFLHEWARQASDALVRTEALRLLSEDGEPLAVQILSSRAATGGVAELRAMAALGDDQAIDAMAQRLRLAEGFKVSEILALSESGRVRAIAPLAEVLKDPRPENRAAAAEGLGRLGRQEALEHLRAALADPHGTVRIAVAGALFALGDFRGAGTLHQLAGSDQSQVRRSAARLLASQPDESWKNLVRGLAQDPDPAIRLDAARLIAPHDPDLARALFASLAQDPNPAIREEAEVAWAEAPISGFAALRQLLRTGTGRVKVTAAGRILELTR
jgi:hypothetical protein